MAFFHSRSLRAKIALIVLVAFIPVVAADCILFGLQLQKARQAELDSCATMAAVVSAELDNFVHGLWNIEESFGLAVFNTSLHRSSAKTAQLMQQVLQSYPTLLSLSIVSPAGNVLASTSTNALHFSTVADSTLPILAGQKDKHLSNLLFGSEEQPFVTVARGIYTDSQLQGVVVAAIDVTRLDQVIKYVGISHGTLILADAKATAVYGSESLGELALKRGEMDGDTLVTESLRTQAPVRSSSYITSLDNMLRIGAVEYLPELGWAAAVVTPLAAVYASVTDKALYSILLHIASLAFALLIGLTGGSVLSRPLKMLRKMVGEANKGKQHFRRYFSDIDELAAAAEALDQMANRVGHAEEALLLALQTNEEKRLLLESVLMQIPSGVIVAKASTGQPFIVNQQVSNILGYSFATLTSQEYISKMQCSRPDGSLLSYSQWPLWRAIHTGELVKDEELHSQRANGAFLILQVSAAPIYNEDRQIVAGVALINDITEKREMEKSLRAAEQEQSATQSRFLQLMAHELRNPMAGLSGLVDLLERRHEKGRPTNDLHNMMKREIKRLSVMLNEILDAFCAQQSRLPLHKQCIDIGAVVTSALTPFIVTEPESRFKLVLPSTPFWVFGDSGRLEDVVRNLVGNAIKYSPSESCIDITLRAETETVLLSVTDHGVGIPEADQPFIFNGFYRASNVSENDPGGVGLGLFLCKDIIDRHSGRIWVTSKHGCGSSFFVQLPIYNRPD